MNAEGPPPLYTSAPAPALPSRGNVLLILTVLTLLGFVNTLHNEFVWDDRGFVQGDWLEHHGINPLSSFARGSMEGSPHWSNPGYYRPVVTLTKLVDFSIWGRRPAGYHLTNLLFHVACVILIYGVLMRTLAPGWVPFLGAALFAVHPVHAESVAFFAGRTDLVYTFFLLLSVQFFLNIRDGTSRAVAWPISIAAFVAALLSKETAACLPLLLALLLLSEGRGSPGPLRPLGSRSGRSGRIWRKGRVLAPYLIVLGVYLCVRLGFLPRAGIVTSYAPAGGDLFSTILTMPGILLGYLKTCFLPVPLAIDRDIQAMGSIGEARVVLSLIGAAALVGAPLILRRSRELLLGWGWFLIPLLPVSNLIPSGTWQADRYLYLPALGSAILLAWVMDRAILRCRLAGLASAGAVLLLFLSLAVDRNRDWKNDLHLWRANVQDFPGSLQARLNYGAALGEAGEVAGALEQLLEAERLAPNHPLVSYNLGRALEDAAMATGVDEGTPELLLRAEGAYRRSIASGGPWQAYERLGLRLLYLGDSSEGAGLLRQALPHSAPAHLGLADRAREREDREEEIRLLVSLVRHHSGQWEALLRLGELFRAAGSLDEARKVYRLVLQDPRVDPEVRGLALDGLKALQGL